MNTNWRQIDHPARIVCTTTESVDILYRLGLGDRVVGISGFTTEPPEARAKPKVGTYTSVDLPAILALAPDLVVAFSDVQAAITQELVRAGLLVFTMNQRTLAGILEAILMLGSLVGAAPAARQLVAELQYALAAAQARAAALPYRPRVYFEEWYDPLISGIGWVGELIALAGGADIFAEVKGQAARERVVTADEVARRQPDLIFASWCGKKADLPGILARPGWEDIPAIRARRVYEIPSAHILQPGPAVLKGLGAMQARILKEFG
jgi:iron complex transport system substrate-binding protein